MLNKLPIQHKEILVLRYILGWRVKDIAAHLQMSENNVSATIRRKLKKLQNEWPH
jgi:RNA polymerase sigma factor (sigma-70 family)